MKLSLMITERMLFQSRLGSPINKLILSNAILTAEGGLAIDRTSTRC